MGLLLGMTAYEIGVIVILSDFLLMAVLNHIFDFSFEKFKWATYLRKRSEQIQFQLEKRKWTAWLIKIGWLGPLTVTTLPFAGGVWTGTSLARVMNLSSRQTNVSVGLGIILGCWIFVLAAMGILSFVTFPEV